MVTLDSGDLTAGSHSPRQVWAQVGVLRVLSVRTWGGGDTTQSHPRPRGSSRKEGQTQKGGPPLNAKPPPSPVSPFLARRPALFCSENPSRPFRRSNSFQRGHLLYFPRLQRMWQEEMETIIKLRASSPLWPQPSPEVPVLCFVWSLSEIVGSCLEPPRAAEVTGDTCPEQARDADSRSLVDAILL